MKKIMKISVLILIILIVLANIYSYSAGNVKMFSGDIASEADSSRTTMVNIIASILNIVRIIGVSVAVSMLIMVACKYIMASAGDKADIKKYAINYVIGALILFGASGIVTLARDFVQSSFT